MNANAPLVVVIGGVGLDIIIKGLPKFAPPGEQVNGRTLEISPGGKGRNIAIMLAPWLAPWQISIICKMVKDRFDLYRIPLQSLENAQIKTNYINLVFEQPEDFPTLAIFLNTDDGKRANYYLPGKNETLSPAALEAARPLFKQVADNHGFLIMTLELPFETACHALSLAAEYHLKVMLDPGGQPPEMKIDYSPLFAHPLFLIKPNNLEAGLLTDLSVTDFSSAQSAARDMMRHNVKHILITHGKHGAYAFSGKQGWHISPPNLHTPPHAESTGCGDQVLAVLCAEMLHGVAFETACQKAVLAGSLQYCQIGKTPIQPDDPRLQ